MRRYIIVAGLMISFGITEAKADTVTFTTNAQATIYDGYHDLTEGSPADGIPDHFDFVRTPTPTLNAFMGDPSTWSLRGVAEFDILPLLTNTFTSVTLTLLGSWSSGPVSWDGNRVSGYFGDGQITLDDWYRTDTALATLPGSYNSNSYGVDITSFVQAAVADNERYIGFVLWQASTTNGITIENGLELEVNSPSTIEPPAPLSSPDPNFLASASAVPLPSAAKSGLALLSGLSVIKLICSNKQAKRE